MSVDSEVRFGSDGMEPSEPDSTELLGVLPPHGVEKLRRAVSNQEEPVRIVHVRSFEEARCRLSDLRVDGVVADHEGCSETVIEFRESLHDRFELPPFVLLWSRRLEPAMVTEAFRRGLDGYVSTEVESSARRVLELVMEERRTLQVKRMLGFRDGVFPPLSCQILDEFPGLVLIYRPNRSLFWMNRPARRCFDLNPSAVGSRDRAVLERYVAPRVQSPEDLRRRLVRAYRRGSFYDRFLCRVEMGDHDSARMLEYRSVPIGAGRLEGGRIEIYHEIGPPERLDLTVDGSSSEGVRESHTDE